MGFDLGMAQIFDHGPITICDNQSQHKHCLGGSDNLITCDLNLVLDTEAAGGQCHTFRIISKPKRLSIQPVYLSTIELIEQSGGDED